MKCTIALLFICLLFCQASLANKAKNLSKGMNSYSVLNTLMKAPGVLAPLDRAILRQRVDTGKSAQFKKIKNLVNLRLPSGSYLKIEKLKGKSFRINGRLWKLKKKESVWRFLSTQRSRLFAHHRRSSALLHIFEQALFPKCYADVAESCGDNPFKEDLFTTHEVIAHLLTEEACENFCPQSYQIDCQQRQVTTQFGDVEIKFEFPPRCPGKGLYSVSNKQFPGLPPLLRDLEFDSDCREMSFGSALAEVSFDYNMAAQLGRDLPYMMRAMQGRECGQPSGVSTEVEAAQ